MEQADETRDAGAEFGRLVDIMGRLRAPGGCPWDRKQTFDSIKSYLLEETYEVMDAIDGRDWAALMDELGDLLLQPVFLAEIAQDEGLFDIVDSLRAINNKLVRRHPHVFADAHAETAEDVKVHWEAVKRAERAAKGLEHNASILDAVPRNVPALVEAEKLSKKAAGAGFEWPDVGGVLAKLQEEAQELAEAQRDGTPDEKEHELGDLLFTVVNLARFLKIDPEQALRRTNGRFRRRFGHLEGQARRQGSELSALSAEQMEGFWDEAKRLENAP